jgi:hypothetical protein
VFHSHIHIDTQTHRNRHTNSMLKTSHIIYLKRFSTSSDDVDWTSSAFWLPPQKLPSATFTSSILSFGQACDHHICKLWETEDNIPAKMTLGITLNHQIWICEWCCMYFIAATPLHFIS